jgi:hypothetical protein
MALTIRSEEVKQLWRVQPLVDIFRGIPWINLETLIM